MSVKRKDNKGRILLIGESQRKDGRYAYKYKDIYGKTKFIYSWRLNPTDPLPKGKRNCKSLRELKQEIWRDKMDYIDFSARKLSVCDLYAKFNSLRPNVRKSTQTSRQHFMEILKADKIGSMTIDCIKESDAKEFIIRMSNQGYSFQTIKNYLRSMKAAGHMAVREDMLRKNPFDFAISDVITDDTEKKIALTKEQTEAILAFAKKDETYKKYYNAIVVLLYTGLRISELCGLTDKDIDFEHSFISVDHQLIKDSEGYHVTLPKTSNSIRKIPMLEPVRQALQIEMESRKGKENMEIDGYSDFIFLSKRGKPMYGGRYAIAFPQMIKKHNKIHKGYELPFITPHTFRHTFCTNMANKRMTPTNLQYIMGHKNFAISLSYYCHASSESAMAEMLEIQG